MWSTGRVTSTFNISIPTAAAGNVTTGALADALTTFWQESSVAINVVSMDRTGDVGGSRRRRRLASSGLTTYTITVNIDAPDLASAMAAAEAFENAIVASDEISVQSSDGNNVTAVIASDPTAEISDALTCPKGHERCPVRSVQRGICAQRRKMRTVLNRVVAKLFQYAHIARVRHRFHRLPRVDNRIQNDI